MILSNQLVVIFALLVYLFALCFAFIPSFQSANARSNVLFRLPFVRPTALNAKKITPALPSPPIMQTLDLGDELQSSFISYAMSTILGRALPDGRDGLKPVQRRVLYAMYELNLHPESGFRKCARVVGEVLGKFHPHGDQSVYDALVRMAQDFVMMHPVINGHGNFGSIDNDPAAAMRYTESKLALIASEAILADMKEDTVDFVPNFDGNEKEPIVLPARLPIVLVNGATGIAVGMATNIPPHNLGEISNAMIALIDNRSLSDEALLRIVPGPDFPTGGYILGTSGSAALHLTGHGGVRLQAKYHFEEISSSGATLSQRDPQQQQHAIQSGNQSIDQETNGDDGKEMSEGIADDPASSKGKKAKKNIIVITELPYMSNKAGLLVSMAALVNEKKIEGISDLRDESDRDGIRLVIELKKDASPSVIISQLMKLTGLETTFSGNMLIVGNNGSTPMKMNLREIMTSFIDFRFETIRRRTQHRLNKLSARYHIVDGLTVAMKNIDAIIDGVKKCKDTAAVKVYLTTNFNMTEIQADAVAALRLSRLTSLEVDHLRNESHALQEQILVLQGYLTDNNKIFDIMKEETISLRNKFAIPRRTVILGDGAESIVSASGEADNSQERFAIIITDNHIKKLRLSEFHVQSRGGRGKSSMLAASGDADFARNLYIANNREMLFFISTSGFSYSLDVTNIPVTSRAARGTSIRALLPTLKGQLAGAAVLTRVKPSTKSSGKKIYLWGDHNLPHTVQVSTSGTMKVADISTCFSGKRGVVFSKRSENIHWVNLVHESSDLLILSSAGKILRLSVSDIRSYPRQAALKPGIALHVNETVADVAVLNKKEGTPQFALLVTKNGFAKKVNVDNLATGKRGTQGKVGIRTRTLKSANSKRADNTTSIEDSDNMGVIDALRCMRVCEVQDEFVLTTLKGVIIRGKVEDVVTQTRNGKGSLLQRLDPNDYVSALEIIPHGEEEH